jgi:Bacterial Ig-like domain (group 3)/Invasin, domain 3/Bacterial Ig-like domain (group 1)
MFLSVSPLQSMRRAAARGFLLLVGLAALMVVWPSAGSADPVAKSVSLTVSPTNLVANGSDTATATATVTRGHDPVAGDSVAFTTSDAGQTITPTTATTDANGVATAQITSSTTIGTANIVATDGSISSSPQTLTQTAGPAASLTLALNPTTIVANGISTSTATATVTDAEGHPIDDDQVTFSSTDPGQIVSGTTNTGDGTYTATIRSSTRVGRATVTATDGADLTAQATLVQANAPSELTLASSKPTVVTNQSVAFSAAVSADGAGPSGTITFYDGDTVIPGCAGEAITPKSAIGICQAAFGASESPVTVSAVFTPDSGSSAAPAWASTVVNVTRDSTSISLLAPPVARFGGRTTYTSQVSPPANRSGPILPSGSVTFFDNGAQIPSCINRPVSAGAATCTMIYRRLGSHSITADYAGDANFTGSTSAAQAVKTVLPPVLGIITSTMHWAFRYTPTYTNIVDFGVSGAANTAIVVTCQGSGCPFAKRKVRVPKTRACGPGASRTCPTHGKVNLAPYFHGRNLAVGTKITVLIARRWWVAKYYRFRVRAGRGPAIAITCMAPDRTQPGVGCATQ